MTTTLTTKPVSAAILAVDWGTVPEWFATIATVGTLAITIYLLQRQLSVWNRETERARREQASKVSAWAMPPYDGDHGRSRIGFQNGSSEPVYDFRIWMTDGEGRQRQIRTHAPMGPGYKEEFTTRRPDFGGFIECEFVEKAIRHPRRGDRTRPQRQNDGL